MTPTDKDFVLFCRSHRRSGYFSSGDGLFGVCNHRDEVYWYTFKENAGFSLVGESPTQARLPSTESATLSVKEIPGEPMEIDEIEIEPQFSVAPGAEVIRIKINTEYTILGYLSVDDDNPGNPLEDGGYGQIYRRNRDASGEEISEFNRHVEESTPYLRFLDLYDHSGQIWSLEGTGMNDRWDTSRRAAIWVPDEDCVEIIKFRAKLKLIPNDHGYDQNGLWIKIPQRAKPFRSLRAVNSFLRKTTPLVFPKSLLAEAEESVATEIAESTLEVYNNWASGYVYNVNVEVYKGTELIKDDNSGGCIGEEHAKKVLLEDYLVPMVSRYVELL